MILPDRWVPSEGLVLEPNALLAAKTTGRNLALTAGPGAGKTEMLAQRADFLLRTGTCRYPRRILAISFKVDASQNLKSRVRRRCGHELASRFDSYTFHAFAKRIIDRFRTALTGADELDPDYSVGPARIQRQSITFGDMVPLATTIVRTNPIALTAIRQTYSHVFLDEFQDCTEQQYELISGCFLGSNAELTAVGDTKQRIMGWAGALEGIFELYAADFNAQPLNLYQNFRSKPRLRRVQNAMIRVMDPTAAVGDENLPGCEGAIELVDADDASHEAELIARAINGWMESGISPSEIAILVSRDQQYYCQHLRAALGVEGIPYREEDRIQDLASEPIARLITDVLLVAGTSSSPGAYRRLIDIAVYSQSVDEEQEYRARSRWDRFIMETSLAIQSGAITDGARDGLKAIVDGLIAVIGRDTVVALSSDYSQGNRLDTLIESTLERLHDVLVRENDIGIALSSFSADRAVRIMSIHKSKGLEFDTVVVMGVENETFWGDPDEQRSAYFVAVSRAKNCLVLTTAAKRARPDNWPPNRQWRVTRTPQEEFLEYALQYR